MNELQLLLHDTILLKVPKERETVCNVLSNDSVPNERIFMNRCVRSNLGVKLGDINQIEPGDVLDELYGQSLYRCNRGLISTLANKYRGMPVYLSVVKEVIMEITERDMKVFTSDDHTEIVNKHFSEISACGRKKACPEIFAFIFGNTTCTIADEFQCFVLEASSETVVGTILSSVAHGFVKTHWEVSYIFDIVFSASLIYSL